MRMARGSLLVTVAAVATAIGLTASSGAAVEPKVTIPGATPPDPRVERLSDDQMRAEFLRLNAMKTDCSAQARQALAAQQRAGAAGRASEAEAHGQLVWTKLTCMEEADQGLVRLRNQATGDQLRLLSPRTGFARSISRGSGPT